MITPITTRSLGPWDDWIKESTNQLGSSSVRPTSAGGPKTNYELEGNLAKLVRHPLFTQAGTESQNRMREAVGRGLNPFSPAGY